MASFPRFLAVGTLFLAWTCIAGARKPEPFDEKKGYLHKDSGVGFVYPAGWMVLDPRVLGPVTSLGINKGGEREYVVTLTWTRIDTEKEFAAIGPTEEEVMRAFYGDKVSKPEKITVGDRSGFKLSIAGGPVGEKVPGAVGVVYLFGVKKGDTFWKVKLRATVNSKDKLPVVEELLKNYRWN
jgi:hypothetical protein